MTQHRLDSSRYVRSEGENQSKVKEAGMRL